MNFRKELGDQLKELPEEQIILFGRRCAIYALPFIGHQGNFEFWKKEESQKYLYSIFNALDSIVIPPPSYDDIAATVAYTVFASEPAITSAIFAIDAAYKGVFSHSHISAAAAADFAIDAARYTESEDLQSDLTEIIEIDLDKIKNGEPLNTEPLDYGEVWNNFKLALLKENCDYWFELYKGIFDSNFKINEFELKRRLNIPKEIKEKGAAVVGAYLMKNS